MAPVLSSAHLDEERGRALPASSPHLPLVLTSFVGRERERAEVARLLAETRLLTLTGVGGVGKTRLALEAARAALADYPDGTWLVELAALVDPALVPHTIAVALGVVEHPGRPLNETLAAWLAGKRLLIVLDNCEHLLDVCASLADALLRVAPGLAILATSREPLRIAGETAWPAPPLTLPDLQTLPSLDDLPRSEAVRLFIDRATAARPDFRLTPENAVAVAQLCVRLDGLPLAIELAAARVRSLPPAELAARLGRRFQLLTGGSRAALPRHQTLRAALDWSYDLLAEDERRVLRRLSVFAGGATIAAAEAVCVGDGLAPADVLPLLLRLVERSLVLAEPAGDEARYRLLETVRQYAGERLEEAGEETTTRDRHAAWGLALAEQAEPALHTAEQLLWQARLDAEHDNLRAALAWSLDQDREAGLRLAGWPWPYWRGRRHYSEGRRWLERLLDRTRAPTRWRAKALLGVGQLAFEQGDSITAHARLDEGLALSRGLAEPRLVAWALRDLAHVHIDLGDLARARVEVEEGLTLCRTLGEPADLAATLITLGRIHKRDGTYQRARAVLDEGLALARLVGDRWLIGDALGWLGQVAWEQGDYQRARALGE
jgi:non-specific serine/threonine protein kinase